MSLPQARRFDWSNLGIRVASATLLIPSVLLAVWLGGWAYLTLISVAVAVLAIEWGTMTAPKAPVRVSAAVCFAVLAGLFLAHRDHMWLAWGGMLLGGLAAALVARGVAERPANAAFGVVYLGIACVCLIWLRAMPQGRYWTIMLFAITWSADIAAYAVGNTLKGPKLWPKFSPNKTWSGFVGGLIASMATGAMMASLSMFTLNLAAATVVGLFGGLATMAGDLWESMLKRRFGVKDSGDLIPGHGGLLDRVDGLLFAVVVIAGARLVNHLGWGH
ncbi:phosphatidate cytidylyltransferase [Phenylobacterium aquaticum]|uniref:phosphatidate cytidylyltransferase n=1 Tax=Phenylobacterium aquaticum TaxID=1763816 RepID=UPI0026F210CB|nr:phosphatidate cytidylyltransferase [Phenylobacterium aquaticum]